VRSHHAEAYRHTSTLLSRANMTIDHNDNNSVSLNSDNNIDESDNTRRAEAFTVLRSPSTLLSSESPKRQRFYG